MAGAGLLAGLACSGASEPETYVHPAPPPVAGPAAPEPGESAAVEGGGASTVPADEIEKTVVVDVPTEDESRGPTLAEVAAAERERRSQGEGSSIVITDANLKDYATGELTWAEPETPAAAGAEEDDQDPASADAAEGAGEEEVRDEAYWRARALEIRLRWRNSWESIPELEGEVARLRNRFYAHDDPYYRDSQIKPAWDRALAELDQARIDVDQAEIELEELMEEGRLAGALPGWLREGIDLEPEPEEEGGEAIYEPEEPEIVDEGEGP